MGAGDEDSRTLLSCLSPPAFWRAKHLSCFPASLLYPLRFLPPSVLLCEPRPGRGTENSPRCKPWGRNCGCRLNRINSMFFSIRAVSPARAVRSVCIHGVQGRTQENISVTATAQDRRTPHTSFLRVALCDLPLFFRCRGTARVGIFHQSTASSTDAAAGVGDESSAIRVR
jgi:hypothetical protein